MERFGHNPNKRALKKRERSKKSEGKRANFWKMRRGREISVDLAKIKKS